MVCPRAPPAPPQWGSPEAHPAAGLTGGKDRRTLTIETGIQNSGLGLILLFNAAIFPPEVWHGHYGGMLFITAWWGIWHIISGLTVAYLFRRKPLN